MLFIELFIVYIYIFFLTVFRHIYIYAVFPGYNGKSNRNMTHKQEFSMSCECFSSPSDRTSAHRSPMVCSRWGSTSNTAGNWLIHCLATKQNRKHVYYSQIEQDNQFRHTPSFNGLECPYSPGKVADLCPPESSLVGGTVLISKNNSQGSKHTVQIIPNSRDIYLKSALQT